MKEAQVKMIMLNARELNQKKLIVKAVSPKRADNKRVQIILMKM